MKVVFARVRARTFSVATLRFIFRLLDIHSGVLLTDISAVTQV